MHGAFRRIEGIESSTDWFYWEVICALVTLLAAASSYLSEGGKTHGSTIYFKNTSSVQSPMLSHSDVLQIWLQGSGRAAEVTLPCREIPAESASSVSRHPEAQATWKPCRRHLTQQVEQSLKELDCVPAQ